MSTIYLYFDAAVFKAGAVYQQMQKALEWKWSFGIVYGTYSNC